MGPLARVVAVALAGAVSSFAPPSADPCPPGTADAARAAIVRALLAETPDGARLAETGTAPSAVCFVAGEGGLADRAALLDRTASPAAQAARLGHLWQHVRDGAPRLAPTSGEGCAAWHAAAAAAEARGDAVESRVVRALGAEPPTGRPSRDAAYASRCLESER